MNLKKVKEIIVSLVEEANKREQQRIDEVKASGKRLWCSNFDDIECLDSNESYDFNIVETVGGEGEGEHYHIIAKLTDKSTGESAHVRISGCYNSYDGVDWYGYQDTISIVEQKEVKRIEWVSVNG